MNRRTIYVLLTLVLMVGLAVPMATPAAASPGTLTVVSDDSGATVITVVYNKAGGVSTAVDLSGSPLAAVLAAEPKPYPTGYAAEPPNVTDSVWDNGVNWFEDNASLADWIWETILAEDPALYDVADPLYDANAARYGRVVLFETEFTIPGVPSSAVLHIAADNGYEAWVNSGTHFVSPTVVGGLGWEDSDLHQGNLTTSGWQSYGTHNIDGSELVSGKNILYVLAGNEYFWSDDGNSPIPPTQSAPYAQYNPGAAIFQLDVEYEEAPPEISLDKEATEVNGEPIGDPKEAHELDTITYEYDVTNTGSVPLYDVELEDDMCGPIALTGLTDEDIDGYADDLAVGASANGTCYYLVPCFTLGPVENEGNATGYWDSTQYSDVDQERVDILHNPDITVSKVGPGEKTDSRAPGFYDHVCATYTYTVTNTGDDCLANVYLVDSVLGQISGPISLSPGDSDVFIESTLLECTGVTKTVFTNVALVNGTDVTPELVWDVDCWSVVVFQWQPRTIGYWGNWDNHYTTNEWESLLDEALVNSSNLAELESGGWYGSGNVHDFLLGKPPFKAKNVGEDAYAQFLMEKQFLAAWLNVKAYWDWTGELSLTFPGTADVGMDPNATVYLSGDAAELFGDTPTVMDILDQIEADKGSWTAEEFGIAQGVLDMMNNAENNSYYMFMDPEFDPAECAAGPVCQPAAIIYGTERGGNNLGDIYAIDLEAGTATFLYRPNLSVGSEDYPNGNAFDAVNNRLYYADPNTAPAKLYFYDFAGTQTLAGTIIGVAASGEFYEGKYYYVPQSSNDLYVVTFNPDGTMAAAASLVKSNFGANKSYGDIAISSEGMLYGSPVGGPFYTIDLTAVGSPYTEIGGADAIGLQLAFGSNGTLYGHKASSPGNFYWIDPVTGIQTLIGPVTGANTGLFTDLANGPMICE